MYVSNDLRDIEEVITSCFDTRVCVLSVSVFGESTGKSKKSGQIVNRHWF